MDDQTCIRCGETQAVSDLGYCGHCYWAARGEVELGYQKLRQYLLGWARFRNWCDEHEGIHK